MAESNALDVVEATAQLRAALLYQDAVGGAVAEDAVIAARAAYRDALGAPAPRTKGREAPSSVAGAAGHGERMGADTTGLEAQVAVRMENVPTSMATVLIGRGEPLVTVTVTNSRDKRARVAVRCRIEAFSATAIQSQEIGRDQTATYNLFPPLLPDRVRQLHEVTIAALHVEVRDLDDGRVESEATYPVHLLPPTTAVLWQRDPSTGDESDLTRLLAAWVTPNAPEVLDFLRTCADFSQLKAMLGYQTSADNIVEHVRAIYNALKAAKIVYINSPLAFGSVPGQFVQRVRLPRESLAHRSANCIDGTVLMASLLEATGLRPGIVLVPGHAYLAFRAERRSPQWKYVETTMIGTSAFDDACKTAEAAAAGAAQLTVVDVAVERAAGVLPLE